MDSAPSLPSLPCQAASAAVRRQSVGPFGSTIYALLSIKSTAQAVFVGACAVLLAIPRVIVAAALTAEPLLGQVAV